jgi:hypothetical protein
LLGVVTPRDEIDALYGLPLDEFTKARNDLVRELRKNGRPDEAAEVAALRKPSLTAWLVNQLARERRADVQGLVKAASAIRAGDADADERFRESVDGLVRAARDILTVAGRKPADTVLREVATTLRASAATAPEVLAAGRLTEAQETSGFDVLAGASPRPARGSAVKAKPSEPKVDRAALDAARRALTKAREDARELRRRAASAEREARRAQEALDEAERRMEDAERRLESLRASR